MGYFHQLITAGRALLNELEDTPPTADAQLHNMATEHLQRLYTAIQDLEEAQIPAQEMEVQNSQQKAQEALNRDDSAAIKLCADLTIENCRKLEELKLQRQEYEVEIRRIQLALSNMQTRDEALEEDKRRAAQWVLANEFGVDLYDIDEKICEAGLSKSKK